MALGIREVDLPQSSDEGEAAVEEGVDEGKRRVRPSASDEEDAPLRELMRLQAQEDALGSSVLENGGALKNPIPRLVSDHSGTLRGP